MGKKSERLSIVRRIITEELISSQEELIKRLAEAGIHSTQSTLSRDFKEMNITKMPHFERGYVYVLAESMAPRVDFGVSNLGDAVQKVAFSANIGVITTKPGYANAVASVIDSSKSAEILGTVAGDNTIILVLAEGISHNRAMELLHRAFPSLK